MQVPSSLEVVARQFHQDVALFYSSAESMINDAVQSISLEQRKELRTFLEELLSGRHSVDEIVKVWDRTPSAITFRSSQDLTQFLSLIHDAC